MSRYNQQQQTDNAHLLSLSWEIISSNDKSSAIVEIQTESNTRDSKRATEGGDIQKLKSSEPGSPFTFQCSVVEIAQLCSQFDSIDAAIAANSGSQSS